MSVVHSVCVVFDWQWEVCGPYTCPGSPVTQTSALVWVSTWPAGWFSLCCFWQAVRHHMDLHPGKNVYLTSWFIVSVLIFDRWWEVCGPYMCQESPVTWTSTLLGILPDWLFHSLSVVFDRWWVITQTSTLVGMSTWPASSFCPCCFWQVVGCLWSLHVSQIPRHTDFHPSRNVYQPAGSFCPCCFWQVVGCLWSLHVSGIPCQIDLHPGRNVYLNSFFCFWQAVRHLWSLHMFRIPFYTDLHPGRNVYLSCWFILSVLFLTGGETSVFPTCVRDPPSHKFPQQ